MSQPALVTIESEDLAARINPLGAELWSLTDRAGREFMTDADPRWWTGHAPILFPIVGRLRDDRYRLGEAAFSLPKHGFARTSQFAVQDRSTDRVLFRLTDSAETRAAYPFAFALDLAFTVTGSTLAMHATVTNAGPEPMPFSFGFHPAFAWPLPGGADKDAHRIEFACPEPEPVRRIDPATALLLPEPQLTPVDGRTLTPRAHLFEADALIWDHLASRSLSFGAPGGAALDIAFPDSPQLGVWQKPGGPFLAIEPWQGFNDPLGFDGDFRDKPGVVALAPGEQRSFRMDVTVRSG